MFGFGATSFAMECYGLTGNGWAWTVEFGHGESLT